MRCWDLVGSWQSLADSRTSTTNRPGCQQSYLQQQPMWGPFPLVHVSSDTALGSQLRPPPPATGASYSINNTGLPLNGVHPGHSRSIAAFSSSSLVPGSASAAIPALSASAPGPNLSTGINPTAAAAAAAARHLLRSELPPVIEEEPHAVLYPPGASSQALMVQGACVFRGVLMVVRCTYLFPDYVT
jgi:hypothetical protein